MSQDNRDVVSRQDQTTPGSDYNATLFLVSQVLGKVNTNALVKVVAVTNDGGLSPVGYVDVLPLINQVDGRDQPVPHAVLHKLPYFRLQGGANAVILDPQVGDIGMAAFASRDISSAKTTRAKAQANPASRRRFDMSDGIYYGGLLNGDAVQYVQFNTDGIHVVSPTKITFSAPAIESSGEWTHTGKLTASTDVVGGGKSLKTHTHSGITPGGSNTGAPV
jgi:hypothetical protein